MDCQKVIDLLIEYLEGSLPPEARDDLDGHLRDCPPCVEFVASYRDTTVFCRKALSREAPPELTERLTAFLRSRCNKA